MRTEFRDLVGGGRGRGGVVVGGCEPKTRIRKEGRISTGNFVGIERSRQLKHVNAVSL